MNRSRSRSLPPPGGGARRSSRRLASLPPPATTASCSRGATLSPLASAALQPFRYEPRDAPSVLLASSTRAPAAGTPRRLPASLLPPPLTRRTPRRLPPSLLSACSGAGWLPSRRRPAPRDARACWPGEVFSRRVRSRLGTAVWGRSDAAARGFPPAQVWIAPDPAAGCVSRFLVANGLTPSRTCSRRFGTGSKFQRHRLACSSRRCRAPPSPGCCVAALRSSSPAYRATG
jgi:hypothetical protein